MTSKLLELSALSAKATQGEWTVEYWDGYISGHITSPLHTYAGNTASRTDSIFNENSLTADDAEFTTALVNWFRANESKLLEMEKDAGRYRWLEARGCFQVDWEDGGPGEIVVSEITGSINDREWEEVARGRTLRKAIDAASGKEG